MIAGIQCLLHEDGLTIKGVQKIIKDHGADYVRARAEGAGALPGEGTGLTKPQRDQLSAARDQLGQIRLRLLGNEIGYGSACQQIGNRLKPSSSERSAAGSALVWGTRGRGFKSRRSDHLFQIKSIY